MNRNLDGTEISTDQLVTIAIKAELRTKEQLDNTRAHMHHETLFRSMLLSLTAMERRAMFDRSELDLA